MGNFSRHNSKVLPMLYLVGHRRKICHHYIDKAHYWPKAVIFGSLCFPPAPILYASILWAWIEGLLIHVYLCVVLSHLMFSTLPSPGFRTMGHTPSSCLRTSLLLDAAWQLSPWLESCYHREMAYFCRELPWWDRKKNNTISILLSYIATVSY